VIDGGSAHGGPPSTVVDCTGNRPAILRPGAIAPERIAATLDGAGIAHAIA
jgi:L-threonylcarbamoyladenylate synthase